MISFFYGCFGCLFVCWSSANQREGDISMIHFISISVEPITYMIRGCLARGYCVCGCWCHCDRFTWCCWTGWLWARRKAGLAHWLLPNLTNFQLQTLLIWEYFFVFHLPDKMKELASGVFNSMAVYSTWNSVVSFELGNRPEVDRSSMTSCRRCSNVLRWPFSAATSCDERDDGLFALLIDCNGVRGVRGDRSDSFVFKSEIDNSC